MSITQNIPDYNNKHGGQYETIRHYYSRKTHSGKTTFARELEKEFPHSFVMDQDNQAEFINAHYEKLQPAEGTNTFKHGLSKFIVDYAKEHTSLHLIICNSNRSKTDDYIY